MVLCDPSDWPARFSDLEEHSLSGFPSPVPLAHSLRCASPGAAGHRPQCCESVLRVAAPVACSWPGTGCSALRLAVGLLMEAIRLSHRLAPISSSSIEVPVFSVSVRC